MKKILALVIVGLLCFSTFSMFTPKVHAQTVDISAQYSSFVNARNNYKAIFGQDVLIGQTVERTLSGLIDDPPAHLQWQSWVGQTYPNFDGFSIRVETIQPDDVYKIIGIGYMAGSQPSASGWMQVNSPFRIAQMNYMVNDSWPSPWGTCYNRIYVDAETGRIDFSAKWYNWPALIDASAFIFAITIAKPESTLPPFSYDTSRVRASYAHDTDTNRVVMFGGTTYDGSDFRSDLWTFDPVTSQWTTVSANSGPSERVATAMAYSDVANNFLFFGGGTLAGEVSDTWKFQFIGSEEGAWTYVTDVGPSPRKDAPMVYDSKNNLFILFGGEKYVYSLGDTWVFDPSVGSWSDKRPSPSPPQRTRSAMAYDAKSGKSLLFGGLNKGAGLLQGDTWLYDASTNTWQQVVTTKAPSARQFPSLASDGDGAFYLFGGWKMDAEGYSQYLGDTWKFDVTTSEWTKLSPSTSPSVQSQGTLVNIGNGKFILMGGWEDSPLGDIWILDSNLMTWSPPVAPPPKHFDPRVDGFGFKNYDYNEATCPMHGLKQIYDECVASFPSLHIGQRLLLATYAWALDSFLLSPHLGHCYGMSTSALYYFFHSTEITDLGFTCAYEIHKEHLESSASPVKTKIEMYQHSQAFDAPRILRSIRFHLFRALGLATIDLEEQCDAIAEEIGKKGYALVSMTMIDPVSNKYWLHEVLAYQYDQRVNPERHTCSCYDSNKYPWNEFDLRLAWDATTENLVILNKDYATNLRLESFWLDEGTPLVNWDFATNGLVTWLFENLVDLWEALVKFASEAPDLWNQFVEWIMNYAKDVWSATVQLVLSCPADLHVYNVDGNHVGLTPAGDIEIGFPALFFVVGDTQQAVLVNPDAGDYRMEVVGTGKGSFTLKLSSIVDGTTISGKTISGEIEEGERKTHQISYETSGELTTKEAFPLWIVGAVFAAVVLGVGLTLVFWRKRAVRAGTRASAFAT